MSIAAFHGRSLKYDWLHWHATDDDSCVYG